MAPSILGKHTPISNNYVLETINSPQYPTRLFITLRDEWSLCSWYMLYPYFGLGLKMTVVELSKYQAF